MTNANTAPARLSAVEEGFVVDVQLFLHELMIEKGVSRAELARRMGVTRARITQMFSDDCKNLTIRLLAKAAHALGESPIIDSATTKRLREERQRDDQRKVVSHATNVVPLWKELPVMSVGADCGNGDVRLDAVVRKLGAAGGRR